MDIYQTASEWHSGQWSPLYAFASSGTIVNKSVLVSEIEDCINTVSSKPERFDIDELSKLEELLEYVELQPDAESEPEVDHFSSKKASRKVSMNQEDFIMDKTKLLGKPGEDWDSTNYFDNRELSRKFYSQFYEGAVLIADDGTYYQVLQLVIVSGNFVCMLQDVLHPQICFTIAVPDLIAHTWKWITPFDVVVNPELAPKQISSVADIVSVGDLGKPEVPERWLSY